MEAKKILYATNLKEPTYDLLERFLDIKKIGLEEIIFLSKSLPQELKEKLSEHGINLKEVEASGPLISKILDTAKRENTSLIVANLKREKRKLFRGTIVRNLIKNTPLPLLLVNEDNKESS